MDTKDIHLICDMDGTLLKNDFFLEALSRRVIKNPFYVGKVLSSGLLKTKHDLLDDAYNPQLIDVVVNPDVLAFLQENKGKFKSINLISASPDAFVKKVGEHFGLFDRSVGSTDKNLKSTNKLNYITSNNLEPFVYIGDSSADVPLFEKSTWYYKVESDKLKRYEAVH